MTMRLIAALAVLVSAAVHLILWFDGVRDEGLIGQMFLLNVVGGAVIAVLLLVWQSWIPPFLAAGFGASTLGAFILSSTVGLLGFNTTWEGFYVWTAAVSEVVAIVTGLAALAASRSTAQLQDR